MEKNRINKQTSQYEGHVRVDFAAGGVTALNAPWFGWLVACLFGWCHLLLAALIRIRIWPHGMR